MEVPKSKNTISFVDRLDIHPDLTDVVVYAKPAYQEE